MTALDNARAVVDTYDVYEATAALRALIAEVEEEHREAALRELHHFEVEQAIERVLNLTGSPAPEARRILTEALESKLETPADVDPFTVRALILALATYPPDSELGTSDPFIDVGVFAGDNNEWHTVIEWGVGVHPYAPKETS